MRGLGGKKNDLLDLVETFFSWAPGNGPALRAFYWREDSILCESLQGLAKTCAADHQVAGESPLPRQVFGPFPISNGLPNNAHCLCDFAGGDRVHFRIGKQTEN